MAGRGLFGRGDGVTRLPSGTVAMMERFGRFEFDPQGSADDPEAIWAETQAPLLPLAGTDPIGFVTALRDAVGPVGGWAAFGGACAAWDLLSAEDRTGPGYESLLDGAVDFLRRNGVPPMRVKGYLWSHWLGHGGTVDTWIPPILTPSAAAAAITPLAAGELRRIAQLGHQPDSNVILVRLDASHAYVAVVDTRHSDDDPRRIRWDWKTADSTHSLYTAVAADLQVPPHWYDPELEPYFPLKRPLI